MGKRQRRKPLNQGDENEPRLGNGHDFVASDRKAKSSTSSPIVSSRLDTQIVFLRLATLPLVTQTLVWAWRWGASRRMIGCSGSASPLAPDSHSKRHRNADVPRCPEELRMQPPWRTGCVFGLGTAMNEPTNELERRIAPADPGETIDLGAQPVAPAPSRVPGATAPLTGADVDAKYPMGRFRARRSAGARVDPLAPDARNSLPGILVPPWTIPRQPWRQPLEQEKPAVATIEASGATVDFAATPTPGSGSRETGSWLSEDDEAGPAGDWPPSPATRSSASWAGAAWASSTRPGRRAQRLVALKMILSGGHAGREPSWPASATEAEAVATLQHPNIVQIYEVGEQRRPAVLLAGVRGRRQPRPQARRQAAAAARGRACWCETLARAMHAAHEHGIVHRDLKPANVLMTARRHRQDHRLRPGQAARRGRLGQTQSGAILGTPSYMAPEQAAGNIRDVGPPPTSTRWARSSTSC